MKIWLGWHHVIPGISLSCTIEKTNGYTIWVLYDLRGSVEKPAFRAGYWQFSDTLATN